MATARSRNGSRPWSWLLAAVATALAAALPLVSLVHPPANEHAPLLGAELMSSEWLIWFTLGSLAITPGLVGFRFGWWWWPFAWIFVGVGLLSLSLYVHMSHLPDPSPNSSDGTSWFAVLLGYLAAAFVGILTGALGGAIRRNRPPPPPG